MTPFYQIISLKRRIYAYIWRIVNRIYFFLLGIEIGKNASIFDKVYISLGENAHIKIGEYFTCINASAANPLSRNLRSFIFVNDNASLEIGNNSGISSTSIWANNSIKIGDNVKIGANTIILDNDCHSINFINRRVRDLDIAETKSKPTIIEDDVLIGANCIILKGVTIGPRTVIGAGSVVTKSMPADCIVGGNPAKILKVGISDLDK